MSFQILCAIFGSSCVSYNDGYVSVSGFPVLWSGVFIRNSKSAARPCFYVSMAQRKTVVAPVRYHSFTLTLSDSKRVQYLCVNESGSSLILHHCRRTIATAKQLTAVWVHPGTR